MVLYLGRPYLTEFKVPRLSPSSLWSGTLPPLSAVERWPGKARMRKKGDSSSSSPRVVPGRAKQQLPNFLCGMSPASLYWGWGEGGLGLYPVGLLLFLMQSLEVKFLSPAHLLFS